VVGYEKGYILADSHSAWTGGSTTSTRCWNYMDLMMFGGLKHVYQSVVSVRCVSMQVLNKF